MRRWLLFTFALVVVGFGGARPANEVSAQGAWTTLLDGTSLKGWDVVGNANWSVAEGAVQANMGNGYLVSPMSYKDFEIEAEFWVTDDANSGIFIRCEGNKVIDSKVCYEVNIFDKRPDPTYGTGAIVDVGKVDPMPKAAGKWNVYEITAQGPHFVVTLNGQKTVDAQDSKHANGYIALQYGSGVVKFRKVQIKPL